MEKVRDGDRTPDCDSSGSSKRATRPDTSYSIVEVPSHAHKNDPNACDNVLKITELLARVLSHLPPRKIFEIQRVSRYWNEVITTCPEIQEMLFLRPQPAERTVKAWAVVDSELRRIQRRATPYPEGVQLHEFEVRRRQEVSNVDGHILLLPVALNPLLKRSIPPRPPLIEANDQGVMEYKTAACSEPISYYGTMAPLERHACMQLTQPATHGALFTVTLIYRDADAPLTSTPIVAELRRFEVHSSSGLKLQDVVEKMCRGEGGACHIYELDGRAHLREEKRIVGSESQEYFGKFNRRPMSLAGLEGLVCKIRRWRSAVRDPVFQIDMLLWEPAGLLRFLPIVPTAEERRAVVRD
jgi:hypothetical protein